MLQTAEQTSGTAETLIAVSIANRTTVWASGLHGTYTHTADGGTTWQAGRVPGGENLEFRDVYAVDYNTAYLLSVGPGRLARIYKTEDGGAHWLPKLMNLDSAVVWKGLAFWNAMLGVAMGDAVAGEFLTMTTIDGGNTWRRNPGMSLPAALPNERSSAVSGTTLIAGRNSRAWFGTTRGRILRSTNLGKSWKIGFVPVTRDDTLGIVSIAFRDKERGMAFAAHANSPTDTLIAATEDGGETWETRALQPAMTSIAAGAYVPDLTGPTILVVGPTGISFSRNNGKKWSHVRDGDYRSVVFYGADQGWAVGPNGRITKLSFSRFGMSH